MSNAIRVENLSKRYSIGGQREAYGTLRDSIVSTVKAPLQSLRRRSIGTKTFWALRDVSFEVANGEVVGIIGHNGAGKTTVLKVLSLVTRPTTGRAVIHGRVGSLLEIGTGFHPELTGRENIFLNGAILGMTRAEIERKFEEIVEFADIARFLDSPVKRYSSGMNLRLAFSVAAHLEPEILLIDEVLAVGDAAFQRKCLGKMESVAGTGRTVIFVSHNMSAIQSLCNRALLLESGRLVDQGSPKRIIERHLSSQIEQAAIPLRERTDRSGTGSVRYTSLKIETGDGNGLVRSGSRLKLTLGYESEKPVRYPQFVVSIYDQKDIGIYLLHNELVGGLPEILPAEGSVSCLTAPINLTPGRCVVHLELLIGNVRSDHVPYAMHFDVAEDDAFGSGLMPPREWVLCLLDHEWWLN